ncbi:MAG: hypothetical protein QOE45_463 [Frankiaceae bacterium]|nr:hypothetical protein [Frankiaceae bacterium]
MRHRRSLAAAAALAGLLTGILASGASANGSIALDGRKRTHAKASGNVVDPVVGDPTSRTSSETFTPSVADCTDTSCDITRLRLTLPNGVSSGRLDIVLTMPVTLNAQVVLYDADGKERLSADMTSDWNDAAACCDTFDSYQFHLSDPRMKAGAYTLVVYDTGGSGRFSTDIDYVARHPDRQTPKK